MKKVKKNFFANFFGSALFQGSVRKPETRIFFCFFGLSQLVSFCTHFVGWVFQYLTVIVEGHQFIFGPVSHCWERL